MKNEQGLKEMTRGVKFSIPNCRGYDDPLTVLVLQFKSGPKVFGLKVMFSTLPSQCGAAAERKTQDREVPGSKLACAMVFPLGKEISRQC